MFMSDTIRVVESDINSVIADIDDLIDQFVMNEYEGADVDVSALLSTAKPSQIFAARAYYKALLEEVTNDLEGYDHLTEDMRASYIGFLDGIIGQMQTVRKQSKTRKIRKARPKTPEQIVKGVKYLKKDAVLGIESIDPTKIVGSSILWVYNIKYKKLTKYVSVSGQSLSVLGTTIQNMDEAQSVSKTLRKPEIDLPIFAHDAKNMIDSKFAKIKAKSKTPNGRINKDTLLIRTFK